MTTQSFSIQFHSTGSTTLTVVLVHTKYDRWGRGVPDQVIVRGCVRDEVYKACNELADMVWYALLPAPAAENGHPVADRN